MKIIILRTNLKEGLSALERAVSDNNNLPILKNILLQADERVILSATNLEIGVTYGASGKVVEKGSVTVPFSALRGIVANSESERITLTAKNNVLEVQTDNYEAKIQGLSAEEFPIIPKIEHEDNSIVVAGDVLVEAFNQTLGATQVSGLKPELNSVLIRYEGGQLKFVATDGFRLAEKTLLSNAFKTGFKKAIQAVVPSKTAQEVVRIFSAKKEVSIFLDEHQILFRAEGVDLISRLIDSAYPDYEQIIPKKTELFVVVDKNEFLAGVRLVGGFSGRGSDLLLKFKAEGKALEMFASDQYLGENNYVVPSKKIDGQGEAEVTFNWRYLLDGVKPMTGDQLGIGFYGENKPAMFRPEGDGSLIYIVMPINND